MRNYVRFAWDILKANLGVAQRPFKLNFVVTRECHSRCSNCRIWREGARSRQELTLPEIVRFAENSPQLAWLNLTGGEPTDRPDLLEVAEAFLKNCPALALLHFPTNGLKPERVARMAEKIGAIRGNARFVVSVSVDGPPDIHDSLRGVAGGFDSAVQTLKLLRQLDGVKAMAAMTLYSRNASCVQETVGLLQTHVPGFSYEDFHLNIGHQSSHYYRNQKGSGQTVRSALQLKEAVQSYLRERGKPRGIHDWLETQYHRLAQVYLDSGKTPMECASLYASCFLSETGTVYPCASWDRPLGNIRDTDFRLDPLLEGPVARELRRLLLQDECAMCWTPCEAFQSILCALPAVLRSRIPRQVGPKPVAPESEDTSAAA